jgi:hypothetical protein
LCGSGKKAGLKLKIACKLPVVRLRVPEGATVTRAPFFNLADALAEDILATEEQELLREAAQDHSDPFALSKKFDEIVGRVSGLQRP